MAEEITALPIHPARRSPFELRMMLPRSYRAGARVKKASGSRSPDSSTMSTLRAMQTCPPVQVVLAPGLPEVIHQVDDPGTQSAKSGIHGPPGYVRLTEPPARRRQKVRCGSSNSHWDSCWP